MLNPVFRRFSLILLAALLNGCAFAPGMYVGKGEDSDSGIAGWFTSKPPAGSASQTQTALDAPPPGGLTPITASLISQQRANRSTSIPADVTKLFGAPKPYQIGSGDVLNIVVWDHPELTVPAAGGLATDAGSLSGVGNGYNVSPQGLIQFPYVGTIKLLGLTEYEVRDLLTERLAKYIKDPQVTVRIQSYRSGRVYIDGEVRTPGLQAVNDVPMTLPEAIGRAGGFSATADRSAIAITRNGSTVVVNLPLLTERGISPNNIMLGHGDLVRVMAREESKVFVMGEVLRPSTQTLRNGRLTLNEALGDSGGINQVSADPRQIFVIRAANATQPEIYHLDASTPAAYALAEGFELHARDVIYVDPVPLVRWNRVISLMLPSAQAVNTTRDAIN
ncbi:polysaccharide biosynthesis/export family protein [Rhodoferax sp.]|uniref:polysaccharide biosynthesis/export family protein n=1 Tax=Rhodoferax sp. TaxID=50421 RepID=UPI0008CAD22D|nr:polysaccharide biosynthesis/export family protein [Rhodoferax sp.]MDO8319556.1 polysaccharide biosynthesis/export family protein [Rhodoferax sp.]OGB51847.1 MAG: sugar transporter [Burkholderiales bacterium RIFOXYD12_FULL_59_19]